MCTNLKESEYQLLLKNPSSVFCPVFCSDVLLRLLLVLDFALSALRLLLLVTWLPGVRVAVVVADCWFCCCSRCCSRCSFWIFCAKWKSRCSGRSQADTIVTTLLTLTVVRIRHQGAGSTRISHQGSSDSRTSRKGTSSTNTSRQRAMASRWCNTRCPWRPSHGTFVESFLWIWVLPD